MRSLRSVVFLICSLYVLLGAPSSSRCLAAEPGGLQTLNKAWTLIESYRPREARALLDTVDPQRYASELALYRGVALMYDGKGEYRQSIDALSKLEPYFEKRYAEIERRGPGSDSLEREDLYDFFRLHAYRLMGRTYLRQLDRDSELDAIQVLSDLPTAKKATVRWVEVINYYALNEMALGNPERALGGFMEVYSRMKANSSVNSEIGHLTEYNIGCSYAHMGDASSAIPWLRKSLVGDTGELWRQMSTDKDLDGIRNSVEFKAFIASKGRQ